MEEQTRIIIRDVLPKTKLTQTQVFILQVET